MFLTDCVPSPSPLCFVETSLSSFVYLSVPEKILSTVIQNELPVRLARIKIFRSLPDSFLQDSTAFSSRLPNKTEMSVSETKISLGMLTLTI